MARSETDVPTNIFWTHMEKVLKLKLVTLIIVVVIIVFSYCVGCLLCVL
jgi:hypothetical protein